MQCCTNCNNLLNSNNYNFNQKLRRKIYINICFSCVNNLRIEKEKIRKKKWRDNNKEYIKKHSKKYRESNKDFLRDGQRSWELNNKDKMLAKSRRRRQKLKNNSLHKLRKNVSSLINFHIKKNNSNKNKESCVKYLDYTIQQLKEHIESYFKLPGNEWMSWNNWGVYRKKEWNDNDPFTWKWQVDHIKPHSEFKYSGMNSEEFKECWKLNNLRPYSAKQNFLDGITRIRHKKIGV